jgi:4-hydroxy-tetrahydrodipicolinate synthase
MGPCMANSTMAQEREALLRSLFPGGVPKLWCPPIAHYREDGSLDRERIGAHLRALSPHVGGLLVPGSTGDGWELSRVQKLELLDIVLPLASELGLFVLVGALESSTEEMLSFVEAAGNRAALPPAVGIVACAPAGADMTEEEIEASFDRLLGLGLPVALYQLPQVTGNEVSAESAARLAERRAGLIMIKDSSGGDRLALSGLDLGGVFLVRGAELKYRRWLKPRGPYDGFLLSTANWLAPQIASIISGAAAEGLDRAVDEAVGGAFDLVADYPTGNAFGNSAKLMDHVMAFGAGAEGEPGPRSRDGKAFPRELVSRARRLLAATGLLPSRGYAEPSSERHGAYAHP